MPGITKDIEEHICVQNVKGSKSLIPRGFNCREYTTMMLESVLPEFLRRSLGMSLDEPGAREVWDAKCKEYFELMSPSGITWHSIHYPISVSQDSAKIHHAATKAMLAPRLTPLDEYTTVLTAAQEQLNIRLGNVAVAFDVVIGNLKAERRACARESDEYNAKRAEIEAARRARKRAVKTSTIQFLVDTMFKKFDSKQQPHAEKAHDIVLHDYFTAANADSSAPWEAIFRREMAFKDARWRCLVPEQLMPLGNTTPDLHQPAEMLVATYKGIAKAWTLNEEPESPALLLAKSYDEVMHRECVERNKPQEGNTPGRNQAALQGSIRRMYITAQIVASPYGVAFKPRLPPGYDTDKGGHPTEFREANFTVTGSDGRFPEGGWS